MNGCEVKPCPFCGKEPILYDYSDDNIPCGKVFCTPCFAVVTASTIEKAIARWNTRHNATPCGRSSVKGDVMNYEVFETELQFDCEWAVYRKGHNGSMCYCTDQARAKHIAAALHAYEALGFVFGHNATPGGAEGSAKGIVETIQGVEL